MELRYRVHNNKDLKDITSEFDWVITPEGKLCYLEYDDIVSAESFAHYELIVKSNGTWRRV